MPQGSVDEAPIIHTLGKIEGFRLKKEAKSIFHVG